MRFSAIIMAAVATLAVAAPLKEKRQSLADLLGLSSNNLNVNELITDFSSNSLSANDLLGLLSGFDLNGFNSQFSSSFNDQQILQLLLSLQTNQFGLSNFNDISNLNSFNLNSFASVFNQNFNANWNLNEIEQLLLELNLVNGDEFNGLNSLNGLNGNNNVNNGLISNVSQASNNVNVESSAGVSAVASSCT